MYLLFNKYAMSTHCVYSIVLAVKNKRINLSYGPCPTIFYFSEREKVNRQLTGEINASLCKR